eukprot:4977199-Amphidinium_carterae.1
MGSGHFRYRTDSKRTTTKVADERVFGMLLPQYGKCSPLGNESSEQRSNTAYSPNLKASGP